MSNSKEEETQSEGTEVESTEVEETEVRQEVVEESSFAKVDIVTSGKKASMSAPVKEFEDFKDSFKSMMVAFANFVEAAGLEIGKDETGIQINMLRLEFEELRKDIHAEQDKMREESVPRSEFEEYKAATEEKEAKAREDYVTRGEFERFRDAIREVI